MSDETIATTLNTLLAIEEIKTLKARYFRLLDEHDWGRFADLFSPDLVVDVAESTSESTSKDGFLQSIRSHLDGSVSVHHGHTPEITIIDDTRATGVWAMSDIVEPPAGSTYPVLIGYGHYHEEYVREDGQWRIASLRLTRLKRVATPRNDR